MCLLNLVIISISGCTKKLLGLVCTLAKMDIINTYLKKILFHKNVFTNN